MFSLNVCAGTLLIFVKLYHGQHLLIDDLLLQRLKRATKRAIFVLLNFRNMFGFPNIEFFACTCSLVNNIRFVNNRIF